MDSILSEAYDLIFSRRPPEHMPDWQLAERILDTFNVPLLGEELARRCIFRIVNHIEYPDRQTTVRLVGRAESYAGELWPDLSDEPHMADIEVKEYEHENSGRPKGPQPPSRGQK
jgi:hypothetical protein